ncbi:hypothetical protein [Tumebacillus permanentifrigoris]|uniref:Uncharacterized protein n=1 Tax=Tumebacillus permanentifrigoris TaxID=378543 RepID=A0A316D4C8_9BACL|nr:hypothetical protein [Tumebacillus permanentifrigoris]PWK03923.1 hypothetical protein C7459_1464 [Tumebacillus permanentifrigoris]
MSLQQIQSLMLNLSIKPQLSNQLFADPSSVQASYDLADHELQAALQLQARDLEAFQTHVALKRLNRLAMPYVTRSLSLFSSSSRARLLREFVTIHEMKQNFWMQNIITFLDFLADKATGDKHGDLQREVIAFEKWVYESCRATDEEVSGTGLRVASRVRVATFQLPGELLIDGKFQEALPELFGTQGFVLAQWNGAEVDLYEIDSGYYDFLKQGIGRMFTSQELLVLAEGIAVRYEERTAHEMIEELYEAGILVTHGKEVKSWLEV